MCHEFFSQFVTPFLAQMLRDGADGLAWLECELELGIEPAFTDQLLFVVYVYCVCVWLECVLLLGIEPAFTDELLFGMYVCAT